MKKFYALVLFFFFVAKVTYGSHASGADLTYDYLGNGQYRIVLKFYRDCSGISAPSSPTVYLNSASCGVSTSVTLTQQSVQEITPLCPTATSTCNGGSTPGVQQYIYTGIVTLQQCTDWVFSFNENARNPLITNSVSPDIYDLYVEATLNNVLSPTNSSPDFSNPPIPYICAGQPFSYNDGVVDVNGNTLVYSLINPRSSSTTSVPYASGFSPTYPIGSTSGFNFNTTNGQMTFTPNGTQVGIVTVKVTEYNAAGQVIGSVIRDMQLIVINCTNIPPVVTAPLNVTGGIYNTTTKAFSVCPGSALTFQINGNDADVGQIVSINSLNLASLPGGNATLTATGSNPKTATFSWTPPAGTIGSYSVSFVIKDNACPVNSVQTIGFRIDVSGVDITTPNIRYCQTLTPTNVTLNTAVNPAGGTYVWTPAAGLSATNIASPVATINGPSTYVVTYTANGCVSRDTFTALPSVSTITPTPALATICVGTSVPITSQLFVDGVGQASTCNYTLLLNDSYGDGWNGASVNVLVNGTSVGTYTILSGSTNSVTIAVAPGSTIRLVYTAGSYESEVSYQFKNASGTTIYSAGPNPATGNVFNTTSTCTGIATYAWSPGTGLSATNVSNPIATPTSSNTYTVTATNASGCSATATVNINVSNGTLNVTPVNPSICPGGSVQLNSNFTALPPVCGAGGTCASPTIVTVGTGTTKTGTASTSGGVGSPYQGYYHDGRVQYLFLASELTAAGLTAGTISSAAFNISNKFSSQAYSGFNIKLGCTSLTSLSSFVTGLTTTFSASVTTAAGWNTHNFSTNYTWDGTSNLIVEVCYDNTSYTGFDHVFYTATAFNSVVYDQSDFDVGCTLAFPTTSTQRANIRFGNCAALSYAWTPTATLSASNITNPIATPTGTTTYNVTVKSGACTLTGSTQVTVAPADAGPDKTVSCYQTGTATLAAVGTGTWTALASNPGTSIITTPTSASSTVTNFSAAGTYSYIWTSGSCADTMKVVVGSTCGCVNPPTVTLSTNSGSLCVGATKTITGTFAGSSTLVTPFSLGTGTFSPISSSVTPFSFVYTPSVADISAGSVTLKFATNNPLGAPCKPDTATYVLSINPIPVVNAGVDTLLNCTRTTLNLNATSTIGGTTFTWSNGPATANNSVTAPNTYTVTGTANGCTASDAVVVTQNITPPTVSAGLDTVLNCVRTSLTLQATSGVPTATHVWSNGPTTANNTISSPNTYTVTATNPSNGCTASDAVVVTQNITPPTVNAGLDTVLNCVRTSLTLQATSGVPAATYVWSNGPTTANNTISSPNTYTVTATNPSNGCTASDAVVVTQNITPPTVNAGLDTVLNCVRTSLTLQATSGVPTATFVWSNGPTTASNTISSPNTYTVTATNPGNGCTASDAVVVTQNITPPTVNAGLDTLLNCVRTSLSLQATSGLPTATFVWSNGPTTGSNTVTTPNTYTVTATNPSNGCTSSDAVVVTQNITPPTVNAGLDTVLNCVRTSLTLQATSGLPTATFVWSNGPTTGSNTVTTPNTYTVTATNPSNGCTASDAVVVTQDIVAPSINAGVDTVLNCVRTSLTLQAFSNVANATFVWSNGPTTANNTINSPNTYTVTATNPGNGCTSSDAVVVTQNITPPTVNAGLDTVLNCVRTSLTLQATSGVPTATFVWSNGPTTASNTISSPNTYTVTATNPGNGCTASDAVVVTQNITPPTVNAGLDTLLNCVRTSLSLQATSGLPTATFVWSNGPTTGSNTVTTPNTYTVTATNPSNGCTASDAVVVTQNITPPTVNAGLDTLLNCVRTSLSLQATSGLPTATFVWSNGPTTANNTINSPNTYTVTATNPGNGCTASDAVVVTQNITPPTVNAGLDTVLNCVRTSLTLQATSGVPTATFVWSNGPTTASNTISSPNTYTVTATNPGNGCTSSDAVVVTQNITPPTVNAGLDTVLNCVRTSLTLQATSGLPTATFVWSNGPTTASNTISSPNTYTVTATNPGNGCTASDAVVVTQNITPPTVNAGLDTLLNCVRTSLSLQATSGLPTATFVWSNGPTTGSNTVTTPNTYTVTATNPSNGCTASDAVVVTQNITPPTVNAGLDTLLNCVRTSLSLQATSGLPTATFVWSNGPTTANNTINSPNTYTVTATNPGNGCTASDAVVVTQNITPPTVNAGLDTVLNCVRTSLTLQATSGVPTATFVWSNGPTTASNTISSPNTYTVTATNPGNGCTSSDAVVVTQNITPPTVNAGLDTVLNCVRTSLTLQATSGLPTATFVWSNGPTTASNTISSPNTYTVTATNPGNGCTASDAVVVTQNITPPTVNAGLDTLLNCVRTSLSLQATSGLPTATFVWSNGPTTGSNTVTTPNTYTVTATNPSNGCTASDAVVVTQDIVAPSINAGVDTVLNCVRTSLTLQAFSNVANATFVWSNGPTTANNTINSPNTYTVTATNPGNGCTASDAVVVTQNITPPTVNAGLDTVLNCVRTSLTLQATSGVPTATFVWSNGPTTASNTISSPNTYTVTATNPSNGCTASEAVVVTQNIATPNVDAGLDQVISCTASSATLSGTSSTPNVSYAWSGAGVVSGGNSPTASVNIVGTYTLLVTDLQNGCTATDVVDVTPNINTPNIDGGPDQLLTCSITSVNLTATSTTSNVSYEWSDGALSASTTVTSPNSYTVTVTNLSNGCKAVDQVIVTQDIVAPSINAGVDTVLNCVRTSLTLQATSGLPTATFVWSNGPTTANNTINNPNTYTVTATNPSNGCTASDAVVVTQDIAAPSINAGLDTVLNCVRTSLTLQATSGVPAATFVWSNGPTVASNTINTPSTYTVTATNPSNGCTASEAVVVTQNIATPNVDAGLDQVISCTASSATLSGTSSTPNVSYAWSGAGVVSGGNSPTASVNIVGTYTLLVTDLQNGCTATDVVDVTPNINTPNIDGGPDQLLTCSITSVNLTATSTTSNVSYEWSDGALSASTTVTSPNSYTVTVTNLSNGCKAVDQVIVTQDITPPSVNATVSGKLTCLISSVSLNASSGVSGATYEWSDGAKTAGTTATTPIAYTVTATNPSNGCIAETSVDVLAEGGPILSIDAQDNPCPEVAKGFVRTTVTGGNSPYNYTWSNGSNANSLNNLHGGNYAVTVTDANGCSITQAIQINEGSGLSITNLESVEIDLGETVQLNPVVSGTTSPIQYTWTPPIYLSCSDCSNPVVNTVGNIAYTLNIVDTNGCKANGKISITVIPNYQLYVPNAFTPNGDGNNDLFEIYGNKKVWKELSISIFNRWGEKVFESNDIQFFWDGTYKGVLQNPGVYVYQLNLSYINGYFLPVQKGSLTLIR